MGLLIGFYLFPTVRLNFWDSSASIAFVYGLHRQGSIPGKIRGFSLRHSVQIGFAVHLAFCTIRTGGTAEV
jgi:hypothetical protein